MLFIFFPVERKTLNSVAKARPAAKEVMMVITRQRPIDFKITWTLGKLRRSAVTRHVLGKRWMENRPTVGRIGR